MGIQLLSHLVEHFVNKVRRVARERKSKLHPLNIWVRPFIINMATKPHKC